MSSVFDSKFVSFFKGFLVTGKQPAKPKVTYQYERGTLRPLAACSKIPLLTGSDCS